MEKLKQWAYNLLRKSERFTKTDMVYLAKGGSWLTGEQLINSLIIFGTSIAFANLLAPETYGIYKYILTLGGIIGAFSLSGLGVVVTQAVARGNEGALVAAFRSNLRWSMFMVIVGGAGAAYYFVNGNNVLGTGLLFAAACLPLIDSSELYATFFNGKKDFKTLALLRTSRSIFTAGAILVSLFFTDDPLILTAVYFISHAMAAMFLYIYTIYHFRPNKKTEMDTISVGKHFSLMNIFAALTDKLDEVLVFHYLGPVQLAIYHFSLVIPNHILGFFKNVGLLALPKFAVADKEATKQSLWRKMFTLSCVAFAILILYVLLAPSFFALFFPQYLASLPYTKIYALVLLISGTLPIAFLDSQKAVKEKYILSVASNIGKIVIVFSGVYFFGLWGAIVGRILSKAWGLILAFFLVRRI